MKQYAPLFIVLFFLATGVDAQTIITDRPDQTESSSTIKKGSLQIESGFLLGFIEEDLVAERQRLAPTTLFRYGITNGVELRILSQFESVKNQKKFIETNGISDLEIGTKIQILQKEDLNTEIAFLSHLILPTGSSGLSNELFGTINKISIAHAINENVGIGYNLGYDYFGTGIGDFTYSVALGVGVNDKVAVYIEPYGRLTEFEELQADFDAGFTYLLRDNLQFDFSFGTGINCKMNYISVGVSWNISRRKKVPLKE